MDYSSNKSTYVKLDICSEDNCRGCAACVNICSQKCITLMPNEYGEDIPFINSDLCIGCDLCRAVCPNNNRIETNHPQVCYAGWRMDQNKRMDSSSGGIASVISEYCFNHSWHVFGTNYIRSSGANIIECINFSDVESLKGSKYVQSNMGNVYLRIESLLKNKDRVLFIGTPCQVESLLSYLKIKHVDYSDYLTSIDFLCHGCVPKTYFDCEISHIEKIKNTNITNVSFRSNNMKKNYKLCLYKNSELVYCRKAEIQRYFYCFLHSITIRECCFSCKFKSINRVGDITLGDFIGLGIKTKFFPEDKNIGNPSLLLINTNKGKELIDLVRSEIVIYNRELSEAVEGGPSLRGNIEKNKSRYIFREEYIKNGYNSAVLKVTRFPICIEFIRLAYRKIIYIFKNRLLKRY